MDQNCQVPDWTEGAELIMFPIDSQVGHRFQEANTNNVWNLVQIKLLFLCTDLHG